jgi:hypothetical protein
MNKKKQKDKYHDVSRLIYKRVEYSHWWTYRSKNLSKKKEQSFSIFFTQRQINFISLIVLTFADEIICFL